MRYERTFLAPFERYATTPQDKKSFDQYFEENKDPDTAEQNAISVIKRINELAPKLSYDEQVYYNRVMKFQVKNEIENGYLLKATQYARLILDKASRRENIGIIVDKYIGKYLVVMNLAEAEKIAESISDSEIKSCALRIIAEKYIALQNIENFTQAVRLLNRAETFISDGPYKDEALFQIVQCYLKAGSFDNAQRVAVGSITDSEFKQFALMAICYSYIVAKKLNDAEIVATTLISDPENQRRAFEAIFKAHSALGNLDKAAEMAKLMSNPVKSYHLFEMVPKYLALDLPLAEKVSKATNLAILIKIKELRENALRMIQKAILKIYQEICATGLTVDKIPEVVKLANLIPMEYRCSTLEDIIKKIREMKSLNKAQRVAKAKEVHQSVNCGESLEALKTILDILCDDGFEPDEIIEARKLVRLLPKGEIQQAGLLKIVYAICKHSKDRKDLEEARYIANGLFYDKERALIAISDAERGQPFTEIHCRRFE